MNSVYEYVQATVYMLTSKRRKELEFVPLLSLSLSRIQVLTALVYPLGLDNELLKTTVKYSSPAALVSQSVSLSATRTVAPSFSNAKEENKN